MSIKERTPAFEKSRTDRCLQVVIDICFVKHKVGKTSSLHQPRAKPQQVICSLQSQQQQVSMRLGSQLKQSHYDLCHYLSTCTDLKVIFYSITLHETIFEEHNEKGCVWPLSVIKNEVFYVEKAVNKITYCQDFKMSNNPQSKLEDYSISPAHSSKTFYLFLDVASKKYKC